MKYLKRKVITRGKEKVMYWRNGKLVSVKTVPPQIVALQEFGIVFDLPETPEEQAAIGDKEQVQVALHPEKKCIFCGEPAKLTKFIHLQTVYICDEHMQTETTGTIGAKVRELQAA